MAMKTKEELNALKEEVEALNKKIRELTEDELAKVSGGGEISFEKVGEHLYEKVIPVSHKESPTV